MAKTLCAAVVGEVVQNPALPRHLISQLQPVLALPQKQRVELLPVAIPLEWARQALVAPVKSNPQMTSQVFLEVASGSFPALAFLFLLWQLSTSRIFCLLTTPFSFAIFSSHFLVSASGWEIFSIYLEQQLAQAFPSVLALASRHLPHHQILSPASFCCDAAILLKLATFRFCCSTLPSLSELESVISWVSEKHSVSSSTCLPPLWLWRPALVISSELGMETLASRAGFFRVHRPVFLRRC